MKVDKRWFRTKAAMKLHGVTRVGGCCQEHLSDPVHGFGFSLIFGHRSLGDISLLLGF